MPLGKVSMVSKLECDPALAFQEEFMFENSGQTL